MGCFNKTGFLSHLPITYGDEIVLFILADESKGHRRDSCPVDSTGGGLTPICPPFFGKYNDYGGIEDVVDDANHKYFTEVIGMPVDKFADIIHDLSGTTIKDLKNGIKKYEEDPDSENHYHYETKEYFEKLLAIYQKLFHAEEFKVPKQGANESDEAYQKIKETFDGMQKWANERFDNTGIVMAMEHKSVYDNLVKIGRKHYGEGFYGEVTSPEDAFDNTVALYKMRKEEMGDEMDTFNPMTAGIEIAYMDADFNKYTKFFVSKVLLHDTVYTEKVDHALYNNMNRDFTDFKDVFVDYAYFLSTMHRMCILFDVSPYHNQEVCYDILIPIFEGFLDTLKKSAHKYDEE